MCGIAMRFSKPDYKQKESKMKRFLLVILTLVAISTGKLFAQSFSNSATPNSVSVSALPTTISLSSTISGTFGTSSYQFASVTSWAGPGSGITVGSTSISGSNKVASATATLPAGLSAGTYTFTLSYNTNRSGHSGTQTVSVTVTPAASVSLNPSPSTVAAGSSLSVTATTNNFSGSGNYSYSWASSPSTGVTLPGNSSSSSSSTTQSITFANTGTYIITLTTTRGSSTATANDTVYVINSKSKAYNSPVYSANIPGGHTMIGNTIMASSSFKNSNASTSTIMNYFTVGSDGTTSIYGNDNSDMEFVNIDNGATAGIVSSSASTLSLPSGTNTIKFARLYWGGHITASDLASANLTTVKIKGPSGTYQTVNIPANQIYALPSTNDNGNTYYNYQAYADISSFVQSKGQGTYTVANIPASTGTYSNSEGGAYAGWGIVVAYENDAMSYYSIRIYDAFLMIAQNSAAQTLTLTNLNAPNNTLLTTDAYLSTFAWEGDANLAASGSNAAGDYLQINGYTYSDAVNPATNMWNGTISNNGNFVTTNNPSYKNQMGIDIDQINVGASYGITPNATSATVTFGTEADQYFPSVFAFSIKMKDPLVTITKTVTGSKAPTNQLLANENLTYVIAGQNTGQGNLANAVIVDSLPAGITYVPGSMQIYNFTTNTMVPQSDAPGDDKAFVATATDGVQYLTFYIGTGATNNAGGTLSANDQYKVQFLATTPADVNSLGTVSNTAYVSGTGSQAGNLSTNITNQSTAIITPQNSLPVTLLSFTAVLSGNNAQLNWTTTTEKDNDHFDIERSTDGINFTKVGTVEGNGTTSLLHNYSYTDPVSGLSGVVYYRLKDVDVDGKFGYSKIVALRLDGSAISASFSAYPNPFTSNIKLNLTSTRTTNAMVSLTNTAGQRLVSQSVQLQNGENVVVLQNLAALQPGIYVVELVTEDGKNYQKVIKQ